MLFAKHNGSQEAALRGEGPVDQVFSYLLPVLLFFAVTASSRLGAVILAVVFLAGSIGRTPLANLRRSLSPLFWGVCLYTLVCLLSGLWSHFGAYAVRESAKTLAAFSLFALLVARVRKEKVRGLLVALDGVLAAVGLLCIDASSLQLLTKGFSKVMGLFGAGYPLNTMGYEAGVRITGIFSNANISAGLLAFGLVISLYLLRTAVSRQGHLLAAVGLGIQALAFFLSFSMGAMAAFAVTCLAYVLCSAKEERLPLFLLMLECVVVTVMCSFAATPFLGENGVIPLLLALACGLLIWVLDQFVGSRLAAKLAGRSKAAGIAMAALVVLVVGYVLLACNITGSVTLTPQDTLSRAVRADAGAYTVSYDGVDAQAVIYSQNESELMMHTKTVLYEGPLSSAAFTVPEGSRAVWFQLTGDGELNSVTLSDGTDVPLGYQLLPAFAANRLQGLWANQNFIQRLVFFRDGIKLWQASPLIGWGIGGVEGQLTSVQSFYYESKYIHNQFIQIMDEAGLLGLASFLLMLGSAAWMLARRKKTEDDSMVAMLAACLVMMTAHSLTEVIWSTQFYQAVVFTIFVALILRCWEPDPHGKHAALKGRASMAALWSVTVVFGVLLSGHMLAARQSANLETDGITAAEFMAAQAKFDRMDVYDDMNYKVNLMGNAIQSSGAVNRGIAARCARQLTEAQEYDACYYAAAYYYLPMGNLSGFFDAMQVGLRQERSNPGAWNSAFNLFRDAFAQLPPEDMADFTTGVLSVGEQMDAANEVLMAPVTLEEKNQALLDCVRSLNSAGGEEAQARIAAAIA